MKIDVSKLKGNGTASNEGSRKRKPDGDNEGAKS
jgi:hypothetical protein